MNKQVALDVSTDRPVLLDRPAVEAMMAANALPCGGRVELIEGVLVERDSANDPHSDAHSDLTAAVAARLKRAFRSKVDPTTWFGMHSMTGPDILILPRGVSAQDVKGHDIPLLIEVSASSLRYDLGKKAQLYGKHGVPDYWVVDLPNRKLHVHREPTGTEGYGKVTMYNWTEPATPLFDPELILILSDILDSES